jgi:hypothetical protein
MKKIIIIAALLTISPSLFPDPNPYDHTEEVRKTTESLDAFDSSFKDAMQKAIAALSSQNTLLASMGIGAEAYRKTIEGLKARIKEKDETLKNHLENLNQKLKEYNEQVVLLNTAVKSATPATTT